MIATASLLAFVPVAALLTVTPGTDTLLVLRTAGLAGARPAALAALGIALGCLVWGMAVALGLGALLVASPIAFGWLRGLGALYLGWIGIAMLIRTQHAGAAAPAPTAQAFARGLLTNLLNPKIGVFYITLLPQFLPPGSGGPGAGMALAGVQVVMSLVWFALLIGFARRLAPLLNSPAFARRIDRVCGVVFVGFGLKLALSRA